MSRSFNEVFSSRGRLWDCLAKRTLSMALGDTIQISSRRVGRWRCRYSPLLLLYCCYSLGKEVTTKCLSSFARWYWPHAPEEYVGTAVAKLLSSDAIEKLAISL